MKKLIAAVSAAAMLLPCFAAVTAVPAAAADEGNLLVNGDFENNLWWSVSGRTEYTYPEENGWYIDKNSEGDIGWYGDYKRNGNYGTKIYKGAIGQRKHLEKGDYTITANILTWGASAAIGVYYIDKSSENKNKKGNGIAYMNLPDTNGSWQQITLDVHCEYSSDYVVVIEAWEGSTAYVDDVVLSAYNGGGVVNGTFADTSAWTISGTGSISGGVFTSSLSGGSVKLSQSVTGLTAGTYDLNLYASNSAISTTGTAYAYAKTNEHTMVSTALPQSDGRQMIIVPGIVVGADGACEIGVFAEGTTTVTLDNFSLSASASSRYPFMKGGEISKLTYVEDKGGKFYRADGTEGDALQIMAENGFNLARIRVLNDPGKGHGDGEYYLPARYQTVEDCLKLAKRAKDKGMQIEFTFAYSDYWVDGDKQMIPYEWQTYINNNNLSGTAKYDYLKTQVYDYTKQVMQALIAQGTTPEYVSIGNEIQSGIFFNNAKANGYTGDLYNDKEHLVEFLNEGARAVRETSPGTKIILHTADSGVATSWTGSAFYYVLSHATYDVMGVSYYPFYRKDNKEISIDDVVSDFNNCINTFNKDVIVMETGYNFAEKRSDGYEGQLENNGCYQASYGETQAGQRAFLTELYSKLKAVTGGRCIGDLYWDPVMITNNVGWAIKEDGDYLQGNVISNSTIFDFNGKAVDGQLAMKYNTNSSDKILITGKLTKDNKTFTNGSATLNINGTDHTVTSDAYGEYIIAVAYPASGTYEITATGSEQSYTKDVPTDGILVSGVDFTITESDTKPHAGLLAAEWGSTDEAFSAIGNVLKSGNETVYGYKSELTGNGLTYDTVMIYAEAIDGRRVTQTFLNSKVSGQGGVIFYIISNAELNTQSSKVYCE